MLKLLFETNGDVRFDGLKAKDTEVLKQEVGGYNLTPLLSELRKYEENYVKKFAASCAASMATMNGVRTEINREYAVVREANPIVGQRTDGMPQPRAVTLEALEYADRVVRTANSELNATIAKYNEVQNRLENLTSLMKELEKCPSYGKPLLGSETNKLAKQCFGCKIEDGDDVTPFYDKFDGGKFSSFRQKLIEFDAKRVKKKKGVFWGVVLGVGLALLGAVIGLGVGINALFFGLLTPLVVVFGFLMSRDKSLSAKFSFLDDGVCNDINLNVDARMLIALFKARDKNAVVLGNKIQEIMTKCNEVGLGMMADMDNAVAFIPSEYHDVESVSRLYALVSGGYSDTLKEAYTAYENEKMRKKQEEEIATARRFRAAQAVAMTALSSQVEMVGNMANAAMSAAISAKESAYEANRNAAAASARADAASKVGTEAKTKVDKLKRDIKDN